MKADWTSIRGLDVYVECYGNPKQPAILLLHGFTGSTKTWQYLAQRLQANYYVVAVDLIGHGKTDAPTDAGRYRMEEQLSDLEELVNELELDQFALLGYSMGGRIALSFALRNSARISRLILVSSSPGLRTEGERRERRLADERLARRIEEEGIERFVEFWEQIPLFHSQLKLSKEQQLDVRKERLAQRPIGLANSLRGIGTGSQPSNWDALQTFQKPVLLLTGTLDKKFETIAREMTNFLPNAEHLTIDDAGHAIHVEKPEQFATMIDEYLKIMF